MAIAEGTPLETFPARRRVRRAGPRRSAARGWRATPWLFLIVPLAFLILFTYGPVVNSFWYSVTDWDDP